MRFGIWEVLLVVVLVVLLFGSAKIPGMMKNIADGVKVFKKEIKQDAPAKKNRGRKKTR